MVCDHENACRVKPMLERQVRDGTTRHLKGFSNYGTLAPGDAEFHIRHSCMSEDANCYKSCNAY